jgi:pimeloyl-ACP methyl ester carboxylesterase
MGWLAEHSHLVAIDLSGFGHSQRRDALLSPRAMGEFIIRAADAFGLASPHIVGPDIGTAAALFAGHPGGCAAWSSAAAPRRSPAAGLAAERLGPGAGSGPVPPR